MAAATFATKRALARAASPPTAPQLPYCTQPPQCTAHGVRLLCYINRARLQKDAARAAVALAIGKACPLVACQLTSEEGAASSMLLTES